MKFLQTSSILSALLFAVPNNAAIQVDYSSADSIKSGAQTLAKSLFNIYKGNLPGGIPGILPGPYYWWEAGGMFGSLVDYYYLTGDGQFNDIVTQALQFQVGANQDYTPANQSKQLGNDDQSFWGMAALAAAENRFPNPPSDKPQWLALAQAVFNDLAHAWDTTTCAGGLRWQIYSFNNGYNYKNTISNACFFNIGARLAKYTGNTTYSDWAAKAWDWMTYTNLIDANFHAYDGSDDTLNCTQVNHIEWTYNQGVLIYGSAIMWNVTQQPIWQTRLNSLLKTTESVFFPNGIMKEVACEDNGKCDVDQQSFKAYLSRWLGHTTKVAPFTTSQINPLLQASAKAALSTCTGGADGQQCGLKWNQSFDGIVGLGEQMAALEVLQSLLQPFVPGPVTANNGGNSTGNPGAGGGDRSSRVTFNTITGGDKAGAGILTTIVLIVTFGGAYWMGL